VTGAASDSVHASRQRGAGVARRQRCAVHFHRARIGQVVTEEDGHQRGLARAVFAQQGQHLAGLQVQ